MGLIDLVYMIELNIFLWLIYSHKMYLICNIIYCVIKHFWHTSLIINNSFYIIRLVNQIVFQNMGSKISIDFGSFSTNVLILVHFGFNLNPQAVDPFPFQAKKQRKFFWRKPFVDILMQYTKFGGERWLPLHGKLTQKL